LFTKRLNELIDFLLFSNIYISIAAVCFTFQSELLFSIPLHLKPYHFIIFFSTMAEYGIHRMVSIQKEKKSFELKEAQSWSEKRIKALYVLLGISFTGLIIFSFYLRFEVFLLFSCLTLITLTYTLPLFSKRGGEIFRLRDLPLVKILLVSVVWSMVTFFPPIFYENNFSFSKPEVWILFVQRVFFVFAITVPFDIRDAEEDEKAGIKTLPVLYGKRKAIRAAYCAIILFMLMQMLIVAINKNIDAVDYAIFISGITTLIFLSSEKIKQSKHYYYGILDGTMIFQFLLVWLAISFLHS
jgi:4-hydroxybenzoate polyprenyltransferase